ncbi:MAG: pilus assembly protein HicB [Verrucomicrobia bacterium]|nr:pilus assembly protein HicB [Verrucomicrobiota bacterium]
MKAQDQNLRFVRWEEEDGLYVGYCPDLFPRGGVCHAGTEDQAYRQLCALVAEEVEELQCAGRILPPPSPRPRREAIPV